MHRKSWEKATLFITINQRSDTSSSRYDQNSLKGCFLMESTTIQVAKIAARQKIYSQSMSRVTGIFENGVLKFTCQVWISPTRYQSSRRNIPILLMVSSYGFFLTCNLHYSISRMTIVSQVFFLVNGPFSERFPEKCSTFHSNAGHYYKGNSNIHFILGNTGHAWRGLTVRLSVCSQKKPSFTR